MSDKSDLEPVTVLFKRRPMGMDLGVKNDNTYIYKITGATVYEIDGEQFFEKPVPVSIVNRVMTHVKGTDTTNYKFGTVVNMFRNAPLPLKVTFGPHINDDPIESDDDEGADLF